MVEIKTKPTDESVEIFLENVENFRRKADSLELLEIIKQVTKEKPTMWGNSIVGFGSYQYKYKSGRTGKWFKTGFSPRKQSARARMRVFYVGAFIARLLDLFQYVLCHGPGFFV
jgi:hypothetical protein